MNMLRRIDFFARIPHRIMDITFGTIPMIVMTFQGYCLVRNFATEYNSFNKKLQGVLRDITITASIFKNAVNTLLAEVIEENTREVMLEDLGSKHWWQNDLNNQLEGILGNLFEAVRDSISRNQETLKEIKDVLLLLSGNTVCPAEKKFPFGRLTKSVVGV